MLSRVAVGVAAVLMLAGQALAQSRIEGVVRGLDGSPVAGATVVLDVQSRKATTDDLGRFEFDKVKPGTRVQLFASKAGKPIASIFVLVSDWIERVDIRERSPLPTGGRATTVDASGNVVRGEWPAGQESGSFQDFFGDIRGVVRSADGLAIPEAQLSIEDPTLAGSTDSAGRFAFVRLAANLPVVLHAGAPGYAAITQELVVPAGKPLDLTITLKPAPAAAPSPELPNVQLFSAGSGMGDITIRPSELSGLPGLARTSLIQAVRLTPGVDSSDEISSGIGFRGGSADQSLVTFDGIAIYDVDHLFGYLSSLNPYGIERAELSGNATSAADGGRLSGVVHLTGLAKAASRVSGSVGWNLLNYEEFASIPFGTRGGLTVTARQSHPGDLFDKVLDVYASGGAAPSRGRAVTYLDGTLRQPEKSSFDDLNGKIEIKPTRKDRLSATFFNANNHADHSRDLALASTTRDALAGLGVPVPSDSAVQTGDLQGSKSKGYGGSWMHLWSPSVSTTISASRSEYSEYRDTASMVKSRSTGKDYSIQLGRGGAYVLAETNSVKDTTFAVSSQVTVGFAHMVHLGVEAKSMDVDYLAKTDAMRRRRPDGTFETSLVPLLNRTGSGQLVTVYVQDDWNPTPRLLVSPGLRATYFDLTTSSYFEPRLTFTYQATSETRLHLGGTVHEQWASRLTREDLFRGDTSFWTLADGATVPVARSQEAFAGISFGTPGFLVDARGFYRFLDDLSMFAPRPIDGVAPDLSAQTIHQGWGTALGGEIVVQHQASWNSGWIAYSLSKVDYTFPTLESGSFPAPQDHRHDLKVTDILRLATRWTLGATWLVSSGRPFTPAVAIGPVWLPVGAQVQQIGFAAKNSDHLLAYHRLDLSTQYELRVGPARATIGIAAINVYDRKNVFRHEIQVFDAAPTITDLNYIGRSFNIFARIGF